MRLPWRRRPDPRVDSAPITAANVETLGIQCPTCGEPINVMHLIEPGEPYAHPKVRLEPCGHEAKGDPVFGVTGFTA